MTTIALFTSATILRRHIAVVAAAEAATTTAAAAEAATTTAATAEAATTATAAAVTIAAAVTTAATATAVTTAVTIAAAETTAATATAITAAVTIAAAETAAADRHRDNRRRHRHRGNRRRHDRRRGNRRRHRHRDNHRRHRHRETTAATATAAAETTTTTLFTRLGFVQLQWTTAEFGVAIHQLLNGLTTFVISHLDKSEAAGTSRLTVHNKVHALHFAEFRKKTRHLILGDTEGEVPHINTDHDSIRFCSRSPMQDKKEKQKVPFGVRRVFRRGPVGRSEYCASNRPATSRGKQFFTQTSMCRGCCRTKQYAIGVHNTSLASGTTPQSSGRALVRAP